MTSEQEKAIKALMRKVNKEYGDNSLYYLGNVDPVPIECIPTGSLALDLAIGGGETFMGVPRGRITELWGPKGSGKTSLCNHIIANAQAMGIPTTLLDFEHSFDPIYAQNLGVDIERLIFGQYSEMEAGWQVAESIIRSLPGSLIVIDSVAAMAPRSELEGEFGDEHVGKQPRRLASAMRRNMGLVREQNVALVVTNQMRHKIGAGKYERSETQPGGEALRHALSLQIDLFPSKLKKAGQQIVSRRILASITYTKIARPYGKAEYQLIFGEGIDRLPELVEFGVKFEALTQKGSYYYMPGEEDFFAQGMDSAVEYLKEHPQVAAGIDEAIRQGVEASHA